MSVAAKYLTRELVGVFVVTLVMLLLVAVGGRFIGYLQEAALGKFSGATVLTIIGLRLPEFVQLVAPIAMYVAILLTLGRLYADQEMVVLQGAGTSTQRLLGWVSISLLSVVILVGALAWVFTPMSQRALTDFMQEQRAQTEFEAVNPGTFHIYDLGRRVTYSLDMSEDRKVLRDVFLSQRLEDGRRVNIWAESGTQSIDEVSGSQFLVLTNGKRYESGLQGGDMRIMEFGQLRQRLESSNRRADRVDVEALSIFDLADDIESRAEWHWRVSAPLFALIGGFLAVGISRVKPREGRFARVVPGMGVMLGYYLMLLANQNALVEEQIPEVMGLWGVHGVFAGVALFLLRRLANPTAT